MNYDLSNSEIYDIEVFPNLFTITLKNIDTKKINVFEISERKDERQEMFDYINNLNYMIGFNNIGYDYPVLHFMLLNPDCTNLDIYNKSQQIINSSDNTIIPPYEIKIKQLDLYRTWHFNNKARRTSLKKLQFVFKMKSIQDLPFKFDRFIDIEDIDKIIEYNIHDVESTELLFNKSKEQLSVRQSLSEQLNYDMLSKSDSSMGEKIFEVEMSKALNIPSKELRQLRTYRKSISLKDCILPSINFKNKPFQDLLSYLKNKTIYTTKDAFKESVLYKGFIYDYGTGRTNPPLIMVTLY